MPDDRYLAVSAGQAGFVTRHGLWTPAQQEAAQRVEAGLDELDFVRVVFGDPHGLTRSKTVAASTFRTVLRNGMDFSPGPFVFDTGHAVALDIFAEGAGIGISELGGAGDFIAVPDPLAFRVLPYAGPRVGWVIADEYLRDGTPHPLSSRAVLRRQLAELAEKDLEFVVGLEIEWYLTRYTDGGRVTGIGGFGVQGSPPQVEAVNGGYQFNSDNLLDALLPVLHPLIGALTEVGLPPRAIEHESGPGQLEFTFHPMDGLAAADAMLLFRGITKQVLARSGYHASFMALPGLPGFDPSGWHLHQSLAQGAGRRNIFAAEPGGDVLSHAGLHYLGGLLSHAAAASLLCVPTINGYRRMQDGFSLSPDKIAWCTENRGAFLRVLGSAGDPGSHIENRVGEPTANPYLYLVSQLSAGLDGINWRLDPGPRSTSPHAQDAPSLPASLAEAIGAFAASDHYQRVLGGPLHATLLTLKRSELDRYEKWRADTGAAHDDQVSEWEHREYFATF